MYKRWRSGFASRACLPAGAMALDLGSCDLGCLAGVGQMWDWHDGAGGWGWFWMAFMMALVWVPIVLAGVWLVLTLGRGRPAERGGRRVTTSTRANWRDARTRVAELTASGSCRRCPTSTVPSGLGRRGEGGGRAPLRRVRRAAVAFVTGGAGRMAPPRRGHHG